MFCIYKYVKVLYIYTYRGIGVYDIYISIYSQFKIVCIELYYITIRKKVKHILAYYITFIEMSIFIPHQGSHRDYSIVYLYSIATICTRYPLALAWKFDLQNVNTTYRSFFWIPYKNFFLSVFACCECLQLLAVVFKCCLWDYPPRPVLDYIYPPKTRNPNSIQGLLNFYRGGRGYAILHLRK